MENQPNQEDDTNASSEQTPSKPSIQVVNGEAGKSSGKAKSVLFSLLTLVLLFGLASTAYLFNQEKSDNQQLNSRINQLQEEVAISVDSASEVQRQMKLEESTPKNTVFKSKLSKFSLTLPEKYGVAISRDGGGEGRPFTSLLIGKKDANGNPYVGDFPDYTVYATPYLANEDFDKLVKSSMGNAPDSYKKLEKATKINGVNAQAYEVDGISDPGRTYFFEKNKVFYSIEIATDYDDNKQVARDIIKGFKFN